MRSSTLGPESHARLSALLGTELVPRTMIGSSEYAALVRALHAPHDEASTGSTVPIAIVLRSRTERMRTLSAIQTGLGLVAVATVLLAAVSATASRARSRGRWPASPITCATSPRPAI